MASAAAPFSFAATPFSNLHVALFFGMMLSMPDPALVAQQNNGLAAMLMQLAPTVQSLINRIKPVIDQPVIRFPYNLPLRNSFTVPAGGIGQRMPDTDFIHALEWPFEVHKVKFSQDPAHTFRDWRVSIKDQTFNQDFMKTQAMVALLLSDNTGAWELDLPWTVRPKGGGLTVTVDNLDTVNPITVDINFEGFLLIPRA